MPYKQGKFVPHGTASMGKPISSQKPAAHAPMTEHEQKHGKAQAPHGATSQEKHVTETHPGKTQPHPETGVHAFHMHHTGEHASGGPGYTTHTHHDDGTVETRENRTQAEAQQDQQEAFPETADNQMQNEPMGDDKQEYAGMMDGIGGSSGSAV